VARAGFFPAFLFALSGCAHVDPIDACRALSEPEQFEGRLVQGRMAIISAAPHGAFLTSQCPKGDKLALLLNVANEADEKRLWDFWGAAENATPYGSRVTEAFVTGRLARKDRGWGLEVTKLDGMHLIAVRRSGYDLLGAIDASVEKKPK
jgi:hypothetical protein